MSTGLFLEHDWDLRGLSNTLTDSVGGIVGTIKKSTNGTLPVHTETGIVFNGTPKTATAETEGGYIDLGSLMVGGEMTIEAIVKFNLPYNYYQRYFQFAGDGVGDLQDIVVYTEGTNNELNLVIWKDNSHQSHSKSGIIPDSTRLHIVASIGDNGYNRLYINGEIEVEKLSNQYIPYRMERSTCSIGSHPEPTSDAHEYFNGEVSLFKIYSGAMTQDDVTAAYNTAIANGHEFPSYSYTEWPTKTTEWLNQFKNYTSLFTQDDEQSSNTELEIIPTDSNPIKLQFIGNQYSNDDEEHLYLLIIENPNIKFSYINPLHSSFSICNIEENDTKLSFKETSNTFWEETEHTIQIENHSGSPFKISLSTTWDDHPDWDGDDLGFKITSSNAFTLPTPPSNSSGSGGSGDPYIHPLIGPVYKLPDAPGNCRFISTKEDLDNRFLVDMSIEKLTFDEQKDLLKQHLLYNRDVLQKNKITIDGYYFRNFYISNKNNYLIVNLEDRTLKSAEGEITLDHLYKKGGVATYKNFEISVIKTTKNTYKKIANYDKTLVVYTVKVKTYNEVYGNVEIELFSLDNKQIRNSIQIYTDKSITVNNSVGAYLMPQHIINNVILC